MAHSASNCAAKLTNKELTNKGSTTVHLLRHVYLVLDSLVSAEVQPDCVDDWAFSLSPSLNLSYSPSLPHSLFLSHPPSPFRLIPKSPPFPVSLTRQSARLRFTGRSSPLPRCGFLGVVCESWEAYLNGSCWGCVEDQKEKRGRCLSMGFSATPLTLVPQPGTSHAAIPQPAGNENSDSSSDARASNSTEGERRANDSASETRAPHVTEVPATVPGFPVKVFLGTAGQKPFCGESFRYIEKGGRGESCQQERGVSAALR